MTSGHSFFEEAVLTERLKDAETQLAQLRLLNANRESELQLKLRQKEEQLAVALDKLQNRRKSENAIDLRSKLNALEAKAEETRRIIDLKLFQTKFAQTALPGPNKQDLYHSISYRNMPAIVPEIIDNPELVRFLEESIKKEESGRLAAEQRVQLLQVQLKQLEAKCLKLSSELEERDKKIDDLLEEIDRNRGTEFELNAKLDQARVEINALHNRMNWNEDMNREFPQKIASLLNINDNLEKQLAATEREKHNLRRVSENQLTDVLTSQTRLENSFLDLKRENEVLRLSISQLSSELEKLRANEKDLKDRHELELELATSKFQDALKEMEKPVIVVSPPSPKMQTSSKALSIEEINNLSMDDKSQEDPPDMIPKTEISQIYFDVEQQKQEILQLKNQICDQCVSSDSHIESLKLENMHFKEELEHIAKARKSENDFFNEQIKALKDNYIKLKLEHAKLYDEKDSKDLQNAKLIKRLQLEISQYRAEITRFNKISSS